jgi:hypothetical protein
VKYMYLSVATSIFGAPVRPIDRDGWTPSFCLKLKVVAWPLPAPAEGRDLHSFCTNYAQLLPVI